eukprot:comp22333_c0_seq1/m.33213 comp22333_c0_seq1/g.33213  ORF comp22333_c0_seq1/g.33213 comp22333_c0_seq1/m.33213 type:complete len:287 (-) comp22333_c0_seq1:309-1169(-)
MTEVHDTAGGVQPHELASKLTEIQQETLTSDVDKLTVSDAEETQSRENTTNPHTGKAQPETSGNNHSAQGQGKPTPEKKKARDALTMFELKHAPEVSILTTSTSVPEFSAQSETSSTVPDIIATDDTGRERSMSGEEYIGELIAEGRHFHMPIRRRSSYNRGLRMVVIFGKDGEIKHELPVAKIQVFRKITDGPTPLLEMVCDGQTYRIETDKEETLNQWYQDLKREKVVAVGEEEEKYASTPKYARSPAASPVNSPRGGRQKKLTLGPLTALFKSSESAGATDGK